MAGEALTPGHRGSDQVPQSNRPYLKWPATVLVVGVEGLKILRLSLLLLLLGHWLDRASVRRDPRLNRSNSLWGHVDPRLLRLRLLNVIHRFWLDARIFIKTRVPASTERVLNRRVTRLAT